MKNIIRLFFAYPTGQEVAFAVVVGLSIGIGLGHILFTNGIYSWKEFFTFIKKD
jgi:hypothetical protein